MTQLPRYVGFALGALFALGILWLFIRDTEDL